MRVFDRSVWKTTHVEKFVYQDRFLAFSPEQHPIILQIGGNNLDNIAKATELANPYGYDEINFKYVHSYSSFLFGILSFFFFIFRHMDQ